MPVTSRFLGARRVMALTAGALLVLTGCTQAAGAGSTSAPDAASSSSSSTSTDRSPADLAVSPADGAKGVTPDAEVTVQAKTGTLESVTVSDDDGHDVEGRLQGFTWTSTQRLRPAATYTVTTRSTGPGGASSTRRSTFSTHEPAVTATYSIVYSGETVGVAMPATIQFDSEVTTKAQRRAIEEAVSVTTSPRTEGSWGWLDNRQLMWRPKEFWAPGTKVSIDAPLTGFQTGPDKWVGEDQKGSMVIGREQLTTVDIARHTMTVTRGGQTVRTVPISAGRPGPETETRSGMKVIITKEREVTMDSSTLGIDEGEPGYYKIDTLWNMRVTWTGEYLHSAPWSQGSQGSSNVSHGCVNQSPADARWMYENSLLGDPVNFVGSTREFQPTEGIGVWAYDWAGWQKQSARRG